VNSRLLLLAAATGCALLGSFIVFSNEYADHAPAPRNVPIQVVASPQAVAQLQAGLATASPGGFSVTQAPSPAAARDAIGQQQADGAIIIAGQGPAQILIAGAQGLTLAGRRSRVWWRVLAVALYAVLVALSGVVILDIGFGALTGHFAAIFGIGIFGALSYMLFAFACQELAGIAGTGVAALFFIFTGIAVNGATTAAPLLPAVYRQISPWTPNGAIVHAVRTVTYFQGYGIGQPLLALAIWLAATLLLIAGNDLRRVAGRRASTTDASSIGPPAGIGGFRRATS
jgi:hypothetical protein